VLSWFIFDFGLVLSKDFHYGVGIVYFFFICFFGRSLHGNNWDISLGWEEIMATDFYEVLGCKYIIWNGSDGFHVYGFGKVMEVEYKHARFNKGLFLVDLGTGVPGTEYCMYC
jgi:hypothetical protein